MAGRREDDAWYALFHRRAQHIEGATHIGLKRRFGVPISAHDCRLRGQVIDEVRPGKCSQHSRLVPNIPLRQLEPGFIA